MSAAWGEGVLRGGVVGGAVRSWLVLAGLGGCPDCGSRLPVRCGELLVTGGCDGSQSGGAAAGADTGQDSAARAVGGAAGPGPGAYPASLGRCRTGRCGAAGQRAERPARGSV